MGCNRLPRLCSDKRPEGHPLLVDPSHRLGHLRGLRSSRRRPKLGRGVALCMLVSLVDVYSSPLCAGLTKLEYFPSLCASTSKTPVSLLRELL